MLADQAKKAYQEASKALGEAYKGMVQTRPPVGSWKWTKEEEAYWAAYKAMVSARTWYLSFP